MYRKTSALARIPEWTEETSEPAKSPAITALTAGGEGLLFLFRFLLLLYYPFIICCPLFLFLGGAAIFLVALFLFLLVGVRALRIVYCSRCAKSNNFFKINGLRF